MAAPDTTAPQGRVHTAHIAGRDLVLQQVVQPVVASLSADRSVHRPPILGRCALAGPDEVRAATAAAVAAAPLWADVPPADRFALGPVFCRRLADAAGEFTALLVAEGCPRRIADWLLDSMSGMFDAESCRWYLGLVRREWRDGDRRLVLQHHPDGVLAINPPGNAAAFSAATAALHGLMAGNAVVVRVPRRFPSSTTFLLRHVLVPCLEEAHAPPGTLNFFCSAPDSVLRHWLDDPGVDDILYYGNSERGLGFQRACSDRGKKAVLELSGNDTVVVWKDASIPGAVESLVAAFHGSGQMCIAPNRAVIHPSVADDLIAALRVRVAGIRPGRPEDDTTLLTPVPGDAHVAVLREALAAGAVLVCGGRRLTLAGTPHPAGPFLEPTLLRVDGLGTAAGLSAVREETFFPLLTLVVPHPEADDGRLLSDVIGFLNRNRYGLRNSLWTGDPAVAERFVAGVRNGAMLKVNQPHLDFVHLLPSHGGTGRSGGVHGEATYVFLKTSHLQSAVLGP
ncbi:aldehyde dehydrogenase family protein [Saccharothrix australiensis]|uniref:Acyl-CoA reductase-like NAD-dependent aldehyde dehydrogenase n=1 Tax=Saccharothrix australiensis TaxID=2072 RepID=A0A495VY01_9PSEU|nr:aldehyde dehydrogenase [Saccharothrix australiensis]RKT53617.1 acyl-CoA reductase-like NAD-dependent aldehyde dehydrogenase [Saccharothrix australiensis]